MRIYKFKKMNSCQYRPELIIVLCGRSIAVLKSGLENLSETKIAKQ